ncbi:MAG TPA: ABC transporter ATP-binding protein [Anaerolinea thermolimosa]|uniref:ABC transporter ATP-binding protein n=1 Tax=Anaerolinea thermolimosa TaxID=229919 RepID=A0A3D1JIN9_9CHLR|nr:ABC transporter ATP-binding protein [Anaerolinea thermolimosa]GAP07056.1 ABC-type multidrug transport system, ATPase and permease components [Anaerolinea thermolimosa]HCE18097.1 ABC transporter ATP-binding protein [Anaerolinea thermolimosa]
MTVSAKVLNYDLKNVVTPNRLTGLWRMMSGFRWHYLGATLSLGVSATAKTLTYILLRFFVDNYFTPGPKPVPLPVVALGFIVLAAFEGGFSFLSGRLSAQTAEGITRRLRNYLFDHIQHLPFSYHRKTQTGELIQRCTSDVDAVRRFFADQAIGVGRIILLFVINFVAILRLNATLGWISIVVVPLVVATSAIFFRRVSKAYEAFQEQDAVLTTTLQENLTGVRVVKAFARQQYEIEKFERDNQEKFKRGKHLVRMHSLFWPASDILCGAQILVGYYVGAMMVIRDEITIGTFLAYMGLVVWIIWPMRNLGRLIVQTSTGLVSFGRVLEIIRQDREPLDEGDVIPDGNLRGELVFEHVGFQYEDGGKVLEDITFSCSPGQVVALLGSTGSGKTTLVNLLPRFYDCTEGRILLDGIDLRRYPRRYLRKQIGIVEQEPFLFSRTIAENITYGVGRDVPQEEIEAAAKAAAIHDSIITFPNGYHTLVGEKGVTLSGGQKQRVAIARTLLKNPRILILDDSTSSVDTETEAEIREALQRLMENRTTFIIAHRIQSIMDADLILVMDKGRIVQRGTHAELVEQEGIYRQIYEIQTRIEAELEKEIENAS